MAVDGFANDGFTSRRSVRRCFWSVVVVVVGRDVLVGRLTEHLVPCGGVEVGKLGRIRRDGGEPIIKDDVKLGRDGARLQVQNKRDRGGVLIAEADVDASLGAGAPTRQLVPIRKAAIEHVDGATPNMDVLELRLSPARASKEVVRRDSGRLDGHMVPEVDCLLHRHRPQLGIGNLRPVNRGVKHHRASDRHDRLDRALGDAVVVMGPNTGEPNRLLEGGKVVREGVRRERLPVVGLVLLRDDADVAAKKLVLLLGLQRLMGVQVGLELDMDVARGVVDKDAAARVQISLVRLASGREEASLRRADEVVNGDALAREEVVSTEGVNLINDDSSTGSGGGSNLLLGKLASGAHRRAPDPRASSMESSNAFRVRDGPASHQELDPIEPKVAKAVVPS